jgi:hypothetical protein
MPYLIGIGLVSFVLSPGCSNDEGREVRQAKTAGDADTGTPADDEPDTPTEDTGTPDDTEPPATTREICYLGADRNSTTCLDAEPVSPLPTDYEYPAPLNGSSQYREPEVYLDLTKVDSSLKLAPNFAMDELAQDWKGRYAVVQPHAVDRLQDLRDELGPLVVNSGYRNPDYNASVGGATHSRHMYGDAFDLDPVDVSLSTLAETCEDHSAGYVGVYETHIHCDWRDDKMDDDFFGASWRSAFTNVVELDAEIVSDDGNYEAPAWGWDEGEPLREWTAIGYNGEVLITHIGRTFQPPPGTKGVEVVVGRAVLRRISTAQ